MGMSLRRAGELETKGARGWSTSALLLGLLTLAACSQTTVPLPRVLSATAQIREDNQLILEVSVILDREGVIYIEYENSESGRLRTTTTASPGTTHILPIVRLKPQRTYSYQVFAMDERAIAAAGPTGSFTTGRLPTALESITINATGRPTSELVLMDHGDSSQSFMIVIDQDSDIVWYFANPNPYPPQRSGLHGIRQRPNYNLVFYTGRVRTPCCLREITPLGEIVSQLVFNKLDETPHHDFLILADGRIMYLADVTRTIDDSANGGNPETPVTGDAIRIWDPESGTTEEVWNAFDHLSIEDRVVWDTERGVRWTHFNSIQISPSGSIVISSRNRNQVISIDPDFERIEWLLNGPGSTYQFLDPADKFYRQHTASELPNGNILVFDNGVDRPEEEGGEYSRALELALRNNDSTAVKVWEYRSKPDIFSRIISGAFRLENGNTLINFGTTPDVKKIPITVVEVDRDGREVWRLEMLGPSLRNRFRAYPHESIFGETRIDESRKR